MSNKERRKFNKKVYQHHGYITPDTRAVNKETDGIPVHSLDEVRRRYWAQVNRYQKFRNVSLYYLSLEAA